MDSHFQNQFVFTFSSNSAFRHFLLKPIFFSLFLHIDFSFLHFLLPLSLLFTFFYVLISFSRYFRSLLLFIPPQTAPNLLFLLSPLPARPPSHLSPTPPPLPPLSLITGRNVTECKFFSLFFPSRIERRCLRSLRGRLIAGVSVIALVPRRKKRKRGTDKHWERGMSMVKGMVREGERESVNIAIGFTISLLFHTENYTLYMYLIICLFLPSNKCSHNACIIISQHISFFSSRFPLRPQVSWCSTTRIVLGHSEATCETPALY